MTYLNNINYQNSIFGTIYNNRSPVGKICWINVRLTVNPNVDMT